METHPKIKNLADAVSSDSRVHTFHVSAAEYNPASVFIGVNTPIDQEEMRQKLEAVGIRVVWARTIGEDPSSYVLRGQIGKGRSTYIKVEPDLTIFH